MKNIIFIGGVHGVGKGTFCKEVCEEFNFEHLSASEILKWKEISQKENKKVDNFSLTQNRLLKALNNIVKPNLKYLLDGHFCLFNKDGVPKKVPEETFFEINPAAIVLITCDIGVLQDRLIKRDDTKYSLEILNEMNELELLQAKKIAVKLKIPFLKLENGNNKEFFKFLREYESFNRY